MSPSPRRDPVAVVVAELADHTPADESEAAALRRTRALVAWLTHPLDGRADPTHVTGSAVVVDAGHVLLHRHKRLGRWLQPGGHVEPGELASEAAARETFEETGLRGRHPAGGARLLQVDVHQGPRGHVHLDLRYLLLADAERRPAPGPSESPVAAWWPADSLPVGLDPALRSAVALAVRTGGG